MAAATTTAIAGTGGEKRRHRQLQALAAKNDDTGNCRHWRWRQRRRCRHRRRRRRRRCRHGRRGQCTQWLASPGWSSEVPARSQSPSADCRRAGQCEGENVNPASPPTRTHTHISSSVACPRSAVCPRLARPFSSHHLCSCPTINGQPQWVWVCCLSGTHLQHPDDNIIEQEVCARAQVRRRRARL